MRNSDGIICDGAVRSGKTLFLALSFFVWAMRSFDGCAFALCGNSRSAVRRNILEPVLPFLKEIGFKCEDKPSLDTVFVTFMGKRNRFYIFGGNNVLSAAKIQGLTLAGVLLDEAAILPESFANQAVARCSLEGSKLWFNCNPESPRSWFYRDFVKCADDKNLLRLQFKMDDNPSLSPEILHRYRSIYSGHFFRRYVLGLWEAAEGLVYPFMDEKFCLPAPPEPHERYVISCDYGTRNPTSFGIWGRKSGKWYRFSEYYHDSRKTGETKTDGEYAADLAAFAGGRKIAAVVCDPSAASFITELRRRRYNVIPAKNEVLGGIRLTAALLKEGKIVICPNCKEALREFSQYSWESAGDSERPSKENDHAMDEIRYFAATVVENRENMAAIGAKRTK